MSNPRLGLNCHLLNDPKGWDTLLSLGWTYARLDANWDSLQPAPDTWNWQVMDWAIGGALKAGMQPIPCLGYTPAWLGGRGTPPPVDDWRRFVRAFVERYQNTVQIFTIWNEPNRTLPLTGTQYASQILHPAVAEIRALAPDTMIGAPELSTEGSWRSWLTECLNAAPPIELVTVHVYAEDGKAVWDMLTRHARWYEFWRQPCVRQVLHDAGWTRPCWVTETGWQSGVVGEAGQAHHWQELLERFNGASWPQGLYWFDVVDDQTHTWGLYRQDWTPKPVAQSY